VAPVARYNCCMADGDDVLVLGPLLRYVDETTAAVWVEVAHRGVVTLDLADRSVDASTFTVHGHHYALVEVDGLQPGTSTTYRVRVDGSVVWPPPESPYPASRIRTLRPGSRHRVLLGSCRTSVPHELKDNLVHGLDVLRAVALDLPRRDESDWPDVVFFLGDQVYADETSPQMQQFIAARRNIEQPPYKELKDYEEYAHLYRLAWTDPANRWLLSTLPSAMIFDDHDIRDDWNTSRVWREQMDRLPWWRKRIVGGLGSYWVYQHLGNLSPHERAEDELWAKVREAGREGDAGEVIDEFAQRTDDDPAVTRWSYSRDLGGSRFIVLDSRCARMLDEGDRRILDEQEMRWFDSLMTGGFDHVFVASSLPFLLPMGLHHLEAWNEAVVGGAWGRRFSSLGERIRQGVDLEHWAAFQQSFQRVARMTQEVAHGERGEPPATVTFVGGDVHHSYLAEVDLERDAGRRRRRRRRSRRGGGSERAPRPPTGASSRSRVLQVVCSPIRNPLPRLVRFATAASAYGLAWPMGRLAARSARVPDPPFRWSLAEGPWFDNVIATLDLDGRRARIRWHTADTPDGEDEPRPALLRSATLS
jgi:hypothetical protein